MSGYNPMCRLSQECTTLDKRLSEDIPGVSPIEVKWYMIYFNSHYKKNADNDSPLLRENEKSPLFEDYDYGKQLEVMTNLIDYENAKKAVDKKIDELGKSSRSRSYLTNLFTAYIPSKHRQSVIEDIASEFSAEVEYYMTQIPENADLSRIQIIDKYHIDTIFELIKRKYNKRFRELAKELVLNDVITEDDIAKLSGDKKAENNFINGKYDINDLIDDKIQYALNHAPTTEEEIVPLMNLKNHLKDLQKLKVLYNVTKTPGVWAASVLLAKSKLLDCERVKLGYASEFATLIDNLSDFEEGLMTGANPSAKIIDAENTTLEHWMMKADTRSPSSGISARVRSFFNSILIDEDVAERTILGSKQRADMNQMFNLLYDLIRPIREKSSSYARPRNSKEFVEVLSTLYDNLESYKAKWSLEERKRGEKMVEGFDGDVDYIYTNPYYEACLNSGLYNMIKMLFYYKSNNPRQYYHLKTLIFNNFNKAAINYTTVDYKGANRTFTLKYNDEDQKNSLQDYSNNLRVQITQPAVFNNTVFNSKGTLEIAKWEALSGALKDEIENTQKKETNPSDRIDNIKSYLEKLGLSHVVAFDRQAILASNESYIELLQNLQSFTTDISKVGNIAKLTSKNYPKILATFEQLTSSRFIGIPVNRNIRLEESLRFGDSTYFNRTEFFSMAKKYDIIASFLMDDNKKGLRKHLIKEYLRNPIFNDLKIEIKNDKRYPKITADTIRHEWLRQLWTWATHTQDELDEMSPQDYNAEFIERMKQPIVRGLGDRENFKEFSQFNLSENYKFTITHILETFKESKGKVILVPTLVLGDADSIRFVPATSLHFDSSGAWKQEFVGILQQDIADQKNFINIARSHLNNGKAYTDGNLNSTYFNKDGTIKCCFNYFPKLRKMYDKRLKEALENAKQNKGSKLTDEERFNISVNLAENIINEIEATPALDIYDKYLKPSIDNEVEKFKQSLVAQGLAKEETISKNKTVVKLNPEIFPYNPKAGEGETNVYDAILQKYNPNSGLDSLTMLFLMYKKGLVEHIQFSGISPSFYDSFEDMQKRWKEQVAPGRTVDFLAQDAKGTRVFTTNADGIAFENVAYFNDFKVNPWQDMSWRSLLEISGASEFAKRLYGADDKHKSSVTDGEAYRTLKSYRAIMIASGDWENNPMNEKVYQLIMTVRKEHELYIKNKTEPNAKDYTKDDIEAHKRGRLSKNDWRFVVNSGVVWQPLKPFHYTHETITMNDGTVIDNPVQIKYAEIPLIPELMPEGAALSKMAIAMEDNGIDLLASTKCIKVGAFDSVDLGDIGTATQEDLDKAFKRTDNNGNVLTTSKGEPLYKRHSLSLDGYFLQNNIPNHMNTFRGEGTQVRKILGYTGTTEMVAHDGTALNEICSALLDYGNITIGEDMTIDVTKPLTAEELQSLFTACETTGWVKSAKELRDILQNPIELNKLVENAIANSSYSADDLYESLAFINPDETNNGKLVRKIPLSEGIFSQDIMANLLSILRKRVVKQQTNGGTAVQIAPVGMGLKAHYKYATQEDVDYWKKKNPNSPIKIGDACNIEWVESCMTFDFKYTDVHGKEQELDYLKYVNPETGLLLKTVYDSNGKPVLNDDGTVKKVDINMNAANIDDELKESDLCKEFPHIIDSIVYRVPTERAYSSIAVKAVKFLPKACGTVIAVPAHWTTVAGFDFDIDKLFFIRKQYVQEYRREGSNEKVQFNDDEKWLIWSTIYKEHNDLRDALMSALDTNNSQMSLDKFGTLGDKVLIETINKAWSKALRSKDPQVRDVVLKYNKQELFNEYADRLINEGKLVGISKQLNYFDKNKPLLEQPNHYINNLKFDLMWSRWQSPSTLLERITPGGFYHIEDTTPLMKMISRRDFINPETGEPVKTLDEARRVAKNYSNPYEDASDFTVVQGHQVSNVVYGQLIGMAATQNILQKLLSMTKECRIVTWKRNSTDGKWEYEDNPILFGSMLERYSKEANGHKNTGISLTTKYKGDWDSELALAEYLASAVDAVKKGTLEFYNIQTTLFSVVAMATRLGASIEDIGLLLNQPVVKEAIKLMSTADKYKQVNTFQTALKKAYESMTGKKLSDIHETESLSSDRMFNAIIQYKGGYTDGTDIRKQDSQLITDSQAAVVQIFTALTGAVSEFGNLARSARATSSNSIGSRESSLEYLLRSTDKTIAEFGKPETGSVFYVDAGKNYQGFEQDILDMGISLFHGDSIDPSCIKALATMPFGIENVVLLIAQDFRNIMSKEFYTGSSGFETVKDIFERLGSKWNTKSGHGVLSEELIHAIDVDLPTYLLGQYMKQLYKEHVDGSGNIDNEEYNICRAFSSEVHERLMPVKGIGLNGTNPTMLQVVSERELFLNDFIKTLADYKYFKPVDRSDREKDAARKVKILQKKDSAKVEYSRGNKEILSRILHRYLIFNMIDIKDNKNGKRYLEFNGVGRLTNTLKNEAINSWGQMLEDANGMILSDDKRMQSLGHKLKYIALGLMAYDYQTRGLGIFSKNTANSITPSDIKTAIPGYLDFYRQLPNLKVEMRNGELTFTLTVGEHEPYELGTVDAFIKEFILNNTNRTSTYSPLIHEFCHTLYPSELKELRKNENIKSTLSNIDERTSQARTVGEQPLILNIEDPENSPLAGLWQGTIVEVTGQARVTYRKVYPYIRVYDKETGLDRIYKVANMDSDGYVVQGKNPVTQKQILHLEYELICGNVTSNSRTDYFSTDYSDMSLLDTLPNTQGTKDSDVIYENAPQDIADETVIQTYSNPVSMDKQLEEILAEQIAGILCIDINYFKGLKTSSNPNERNMYNAIMTVAIIKGEASNTDKSGYFGKHFINDPRTNNPQGGTYVGNILAVISQYLEVTSGKLTVIQGKSLDELKAEAQKNANEQNLCVDVSK